MVNQVGINGELTEDQLINGGKVMSLLDHLVELRQRIVKSILAVLAFFCVSMLVSSELIEILKSPLMQALPESLPNKNIHFTGPLDVFLTGIKVSFLSAVIFSSPVWIYQFWKFIEPALYEHERKFIMPFIGASIGLFISGICFCFFIILPLALEFLINLGLEVGTPIITITDYISMIMFMICGFGIIFETPLILVLLAILDLVNDEILAKYRKYVIVGVLFVGAILTPPDPLSQIGMAIPLYLMYELSILIIRAMRRKQKV